MEKRFGMNQEMGTKWFTFYTKVRPWIACLSLLIPFADFAQYPSVYLSHIGMIISLVANLALVVLCVMVAIKAEENYHTFVRFVNGVLIYETCNSAFQQCIQQYYVNGNGIIEAVVVGALVGVGMFFIWYRPNIKYFRKRLIQQQPSVISNNSPIVAHDQTHPSHICLSDENETPRKYGNYNVYGSDIALKQDTEQPKVDPVLQAPQSKAQHIQTQTPVVKQAVKYCSRCGKVIDPVTKKCRGCGKQYFKGVSTKSLFLILLSILLVVSLAGNIILCLSSVDLREEAVSLKKSNTSLKTDIADLKKEVAELKEENEQYYDYWVDSFNEIAFYDEHIVFVADNGTDLYHKYDCSVFQNCESFWAYNTEAAEGEGYKPCSRCCD